MCADTYVYVHGIYVYTHMYLCVYVHHMHVCIHIVLLVYFLDLSLNTGLHNRDPSLSSRLRSGLY